MGGEGVIQPVNNHMWVGLLGQRLYAISQATSLPEAKRIARESLGTLTDPKDGVKFLPFDMWLRWHGESQTRERV